MLVKMIRIQNNSGKTVRMSVKITRIQNKKWKNF